MSEINEDPSHSDDRPIALLCDLPIAMGRSESLAAAARRLGLVVDGFFPVRAELRDYIKQHESASGAVIESAALPQTIPWFVRITDEKDAFNVIDRASGRSVQRFDDMFDACAEVYLRVLQSLRSA